MAKKSEKNRGGRPRKYDYSKLIAGETITVKGYRAMAALRVWAARNGIRVTAEKTNGAFHRGEDAEYRVRMLHGAE